MLKVKPQFSFKGKVQFELKLKYSKFVSIYTKQGPCEF